MKNKILTDLNNIIIQQRMYIQRKSDKILGKSHMDYESFISAVDKLPLENLTKNTNYTIGKYIHDTVGTSFYNIYLSIKYNQPLA